MKKNLFTILILALLIVNIVLSSITLVSVTGTNKKTAQLVSNIATVMNLELTVPGQEEVKEKVSLADTAVYNMSGPMTIALKAGEDGEYGYLVCSIALSMNTKNKDYKKYGSEEDMAAYESLIKDAITRVISAHTQEECRADFEAVKSEILKAIQDLYDSDFIYDIAVNDIKFG